MRKIKTILGIVFSLAIVTTMNTTVFAANDSGIPERRGVYIRECVGYEPNYTNIDYTHKLLGSVSGDNSVHYKVTTSSYSAIKVPKGMTVYTPTGVYKAQ